MKITKKNSQSQIKLYKICFYLRYFPETHYNTYFFFIFLLKNYSLQLYILIFTFKHL